MNQKTGSVRQNPSVILVKCGSSLTQAPPVGLLYLSAVLNNAGVPTALYDLSVRPKLAGQLLADIAASPPLWLGLSALTPGIPDALKLAEMVKKVNPRLPLVLGGVHATFLPRESLAEIPVDAVFAGEGEDRIVPLHELIASGSRDFWAIPHVAGRDESGQIRYDDSPIKPVDVNSIPLPDWDAVNLDDYQKRPWQLVRRGKRVATIFTTRGCPFECAYCANPSFMGRRLRKRDPEKVVDEIQMLHEKYGVDEIHIGDDIFNADLEHAKQILRGIIGRKIKIFWKTPDGIYLEMFDDEFLKLMVESGAYQVGFGIESGCPEILKGVKRRADLDKVPDFVAAFKRAGLSTFGFFILGLPNETPETIERTIRFACSLPLDHVHVSLCVPYPGSPLFSELDSRGLLHHRWGEYKHYNPFPVSALSADQLKASLRRFYLRFYSRPSRAWGFISQATCSGLKAFVYVGMKYCGKAK